MLMLKGLLGVLSQLALLTALLLIPAGTWQWPRALQFLAGYGIVLLIATVLLAMFAPASLEARLELPAAKSQPVADRVVTALIVLMAFAWFVFIPIDVFYLQLLPVPEPFISGLGALIGLAGYGILILAIFQNEFAVPIVRDQSERGQVLIDTGLYGLIRHPFYLGFLLFFVGIGLWLESYASVLMLSILLVLLAARIFIEEKTLSKSLPGYADYVAKVKYRLLPFVW
ncbi:isoprenylcysteine carboxyl methyltransferase [Leptolyngbya sp. Heron Island J]|uniref:methyltransferase family protein n=1 Tax=Leptolyngbya sp. Heron Island J TaxID=1385935 RepID=UPI0003B9964E|nr:isoprenylcysteine carboxylmethyltransferase family protein [Leptolyngbya sp. Heron Island J]ESA32542.1 isoprenylcysteine carboxyl methyltransferase [Leptolyngbya sp. Heron Island J]